MIPTMEEGREAKIGGRGRLVREGLLLQGEARAGQGTIDETGVVTRREEVIDEVTVLNGDPLNDVTPVRTDVMADSRRGATKSRGTIRGRPRAGLARSSGPHWPQEETGLTADRDPLPRQIRWATGIPPLGERQPTDRSEARELI